MVLHAIDLFLLMVDHLRELISQSVEIVVHFVDFLAPHILSLLRLEPLVGVHGHFLEGMLQILSHWRCNLMLSPTVFLVIHLIDSWCLQSVRGSDCT